MVFVSQNRLVAILLKTDVSVYIYMCICRSLKNWLDFWLEGYILVLVHTGAKL